MQQFYTCQLSRLRTKDIGLTHQGQFLTPDSQIRMNNNNIVPSIIIDNENSTQFLRKYSKQALKDDFVSIKLDVDVLEEAFAL